MTTRRIVQSQRQRFHVLLIDVNQRLAAVAASSVILQAQLAGLSRTLATPSTRIRAATTRVDRDRRPRGGDRASSRRVRRNGTTQRT